MSLNVQIEDILPCLGLGGARLDLGQVDLMLRERLQDAMQRPDPILDREHQRSLVAIGGGRGLLADYQKSREIMRGILYFPRNHFKFIETGSEFTRDGGGRWFLGSQLCGCGSAGGLIKRDPGEVHPEPSP